MMKDYNLLISRYKTEIGRQYRCFTFASADFFSATKHSNLIFEGLEAANDGFKYEITSLSVDGPVNVLATYAWSS